MQSREFHPQYESAAVQADLTECVSLGDQRAMRSTLPLVPEQRATPPSWERWTTRSS